MLPAPHRLRESGQFRAVQRDRRAGRAGGSLVVVHVVDTDALGFHPENRVGPRVGFVVSKQVGNSVVRARTKRILRHLMRDLLDDIPPSMDVVVKAQPAIAGCSSAEIKPELERMLTKAQRRMREKGEAKQKALSVN